MDIPAGLSVHQSTGEDCRCGCSLLAWLSGSAVVEPLSGVAALGGSDRLGLVGAVGVALQGDGLRYSRGFVDALSGLARRHSLGIDWCFQAEAEFSTTLNAQ